MRVLIVGASKGIGLETTRQALEAGHNVRALARSATAIAVSNPSLEGLTSRLQPDALASADNQYTHGEPVISEPMVSPAFAWVAIQVNHGGGWVLWSQPFPVDR